MSDPQGRDRALEDLWNRTMAQVPTTFGRIAYLASLRDPNTGQYQHFGLSQLYSAAEADRVLRSSHERVFSEWLNYSLDDQKDDLEEYLSSLDGDRRTVLNAWATLHTYRSLVPTYATPAEKELFISDVEIILDLMRTGVSASWPNPGA